VTHTAWANHRSTRANSQRRMGLFGLLGQGNLGNDGSMEAVLAYLRAEHPDLIVDAFCTGPELISARYGMPASSLRWYRPERHGSSGALSRARKGLGTGLGMGVDAMRTARWVRRHDAVIVPGMGVLETTVPMRAWKTPYTMFLLCLSGRLFGTKVALVCVGTNTIDRLPTRLLVTATARLAYYRSFRDNLSRDAMRQMGVDTSSDAVYPDVVFSLPTPANAKPVARSVGIGVMDYSGGNDDLRRADEIRYSYLEKMTRFAVWLLDHGHSVRLFSSDDVADARIVQEILAKLRVQRPGIDGSCVVADPVPSMDELIRQTASVEIVVAARYHNVLFALKLAKPTLSLSYAAKCDALMADMGLSQFCHPIASLDVDRLIVQFTELESQSSEVQRVLRERGATRARAVDRQFEDLSAKLFPVNGVLPRAVAPAATRRGAP
jgi:polysaccharide pyruvyl transferase WcaK-like protein